MASITTDVSDESDEVLLLEYLRERASDKRKSKTTVLKSILKLCLPTEFVKIITRDRVTFERLATVYYNNLFLGISSGGNDPFEGCEQICPKFEGVFMHATLLATEIHKSNTINRRCRTVVKCNASEPLVNKGTRAQVKKRSKKGTKPKAGTKTKSRTKLKQRNPGTCVVANANANIVDETTESGKSKCTHVEPQLTREGCTTTRKKKIKDVPDGEQSRKNGKVGRVVSSPSQCTNGSASDSDEIDDELEETLEYCKVIHDTAQKRGWTRALVREIFSRPYRTETISYDPPLYNIRARRTVGLPSGTKYTQYECIFGSDSSIPGTYMWLLSRTLLPNPVYSEFINRGEIKVATPTNVDFVGSVRDAMNVQGRLALHQKIYRTKSN